MISTGINTIIKAINIVDSKVKFDISSVYGGGNAGQTIADLLAEVPLQFHKTIMY